MADSSQISLSRCWARALRNGDVAARRTRFRISFRHQRDAPRSAYRFPEMPLQYRAAFAGVLAVAAVTRVGENLTTLRALEHGHLAY